MCEHSQWTRSQMEAVFQTLEASNGLDINNQVHHVWLLYKLFLLMINQ